MFFVLRGFALRNLARRLCGRALPDALRKALRAALCVVLAHCCKRLSPANDLRRKTLCAVTVHVLGRIEFVCF